MKPVLRCFGLAVLFFSAPSLADDDDPRQLGYLGGGVPVPLELYGYDPSLEGSSAEVDLLIHGRLGYAGAFFEWPLLFLGLRGVVSGLRASDTEISVTGYLVAFGPEALVRLPLGSKPDPGWGLGAGAGPTFVFAGFEVDEHMQERTKGLGLQAHIWADRLIVSWLRVALDIGLDHSFDPLGEPTFFNAPLETNTILCFTLGLMTLF